MSGTRRRVEDRCRARSETSHGVVASGRRVETNAASTDLCRTQLASSLVVCLSGPTQRRQFFRAAAAAAESKHHRPAGVNINRTRRPITPTLPLTDARDRNPSLPTPSSRLNPHGPHTWLLQLYNAPGAVDTRCDVVQASFTPREMNWSEQVHNKRQLRMRTASMPRHDTLTYFVLIGCTHSQLGRVVREVRFINWT